LLYGYHLWPAIFVGAFLVNVTTSGAVPSSLGIATGNTLEALLGVWLVRRWADGREVFERARSIFAYAALAGLASTAVSATVGVASLALGGHARWGRFGEIWLTWWLGDMAGALVVAPVLFLWAKELGRRLTRAEVVELALVLTSVLLAGLIVFVAGVRALREPLAIYQMHGKNLYGGPGIERCKIKLESRMNTREAVHDRIAEWLSLNSYDVNSEPIFSYLAQWEFAQASDRFHMEAPGRWTYFKHLWREARVYRELRSPRHQLLSYANAFAGLVGGYQRQNTSSSTDLP